MVYKFNITVSTIDNKKFSFRETMNVREKNVAKETVKGLLMKIARNGYYTFEKEDTLDNPTYYPPSSIVSVKSVEVL